MTSMDDLDKRYFGPVEPQDLHTSLIRGRYLPGSVNFCFFSDLLKNLLRVPLRFRQFKFAVLTDIEGLFLQVGVLAVEQP